MKTTWSKYRGIIIFTLVFYLCMSIGLGTFNVLAWVTISPQNVPIALILLVLTWGAVIIANEIDF